jgi:uncharacterized repeat protein (TIGR01451 family)
MKSFLQMFFRHTQAKVVQILSVILCLILSHQAAWSQISGTVFRDFDLNGVQTATNPFEPGIPSAKVRIFVGASTTPIIKTTDGSGNYAYSITEAPKDSLIRVEFFNFPEALAPTSTPQGSTDVQFVKAPATNIKVGLISDDEFCRIGEGLSVTTPCYVPGDPLLGGSAGSADAIISFNYAASGEASASNFMPEHLATAAEVGSTWSSTYQKETKKLLFSSVVRRHVGLGPLGTGGIYKMDISTSTPVTTSYIDLKTLNINTGPDPHSGLAASKFARSNDSLTFHKAGKVGLGGVQFSRYQDTLYVINLYKRKMYRFPVAKPLATPNPATTPVDSFMIPNPNCSNGDFAPWCLKQRNGKYYLGVVCTAETSQDTNDLKAAVYEFNPKTNLFTNILQFSLNFKRDAADGSLPDCIKRDHWLPWTNTFPGTCNGQKNPANLVYPQPIFTDIEFDDDGSMILGFADRLGLQAGQDQWGIAKGDTLHHYFGFMSGDEYRAQYTNGVYTIESNGKSGSLTGCGVGKGNGIGGGEFFCDDEWRLFAGGVLGHGEVTNGGMFKAPGVQEILSSAMDPIQGVYLSTGFRAFSTIDGKSNRAYSLFANEPGTLGKSGGVGDLTGLCDPAPVEIGNRVWFDCNRNGIQDGNEPGIDDQVVMLYDMTGGGAGVLVAKDTTINGGQYYFNDKNVTGGLKRKTKYEIRMAMNQKIPASILSKLKNSAKVVTLKDTFMVTAKQVTGYQDPATRDSDGFYSVDSSQIKITVLTQQSGENDYKFDIGLMARSITCTKPNAGKDTASACKAAIKLKAAMADEMWSFLSASAGGSTPTIDQAGNVAGMTASGVYRFLLASKVGGCKDTVAVTKNTYTVAPIADDTICVGQKITLGFQPSTTTTYLWSTGATTPTISVSPTATTDYSVTLTSSISKCSVSDTVKIVVGTKPNAGKDTVICATNIVKLKTPAAAESWRYLSGPATATMASVSTTGAVSGMSVNGFYYFELKNTVFGCTDTIEVRRSTVTLAAYITQPTCKNNIPQDDGIVGLTSFTSGAKYAINANASALPMTAAGLPVVPANGALANNISNAFDNITVRLFHPTSGCYRDTMLIVKSPTCGMPCVKPSFAATPQNASCNGTTAKNDAQILVTSASNGMTYSYGTDSTKFSFATSVAYSGSSFNVTSLPNPVAITTYFVRIYNGTANCFLTKSITIKPTTCTAPCIKPAFTLTPQSASCNGTVAKNDAQILVANATNGTRYIFGADSTLFSYLATTDFSGSSFAITNLANPTAAKTYYVRIYNNSTCFSTQSVIIQPTNCSSTCVKPSAFTAIPLSATCNGLVAKADAKIAVSGVSNGLTYRVGTDSTTFAFAGSTAYMGNSFTVSNLPNPTTPQTYFVRIYNGKADCYTTQKVIVMPTDCKEPTGSIGDYVWKDTNNNGKQDEIGTGVKGVEIELYKASGNVTIGAAIAKDTTDAAGKYLFTGLPLGNYIVKLLKTTIPMGSTLSDSTNKGSDDKDSDFKSNGLSPVVSIDPTDPLLKDNLTIDAALTVIKLPTPIDLELTKKLLGDCKHQIGDEVTFEITLKNTHPDVTTFADSIEVSDTLAANFTFIKAVATQGTYNNTTHLWSRMSLGYGESAVLTITAKINNLNFFEGGSVCNKAQIYRASGVDIDSKPGNNDMIEDDYAIACASVPMKLCSARQDTLIISAPAGYSSYQWFRNGVKIIGATKAKLEVGQAGDYTVEAGQGGCLTKNCCPAYVMEECLCPADICVPFTIKQTKKKGVPVR